jgi:DNA-binding beta-propeller fold protein YncE
METEDYYNYVYYCAKYHVLASIAMHYCYEKITCVLTNLGQFLTKFGETGSGDGQLSGPEGVGVDKESGAVYVADTGNSRMQLFEHQ